MNGAIVTIVLVLSLNRGFAIEPACSPFSYVEQILEKVIRQEIHVEKIRTDIEDTKQVVLGALVDLKTERNKYALDMDKKTEDVKALKETMEGEMTRMKSQADENLEEYSKELKSIKEMTTTPIIAFKAHKVTDKSLSLNKIIVFAQIIINIGDSYNSETGIFVAPVGGIYLFTAQICLPANIHLYYGITVKGNVISGALLAQRHWETCSTMDTISAVYKGDEVSVKCTRYCDSSDKLWSSPPYATSSFSGVLIQRSDDE